MPIDIVSMRLILDMLETAPPPPPPPPAAEADTKYIFLSATVKRFTLPLSTKTCMIRSSEFFSDSGETIVNRVLQRLLFWAEPSRRVINAFGYQSAKMRYLIHTKPGYADAPVVPITLLVRIRVTRDDAVADDVAVAVERSLAETSSRTIPADDVAIRELQRVDGECKDDDRCCICLEELCDEKNEVVRTPCKHVFHRKCIVEWFWESQLCPLCRYSMRAKE